MSTTVSMWLGIAFLLLAIVAVLLQAWLWGPQFWDEEAKKTRAPKFWLRIHALSGYLYGIIYVVMMWQMLPRLWEYQYELPARTVIHAVFGITIGVLLITKIAILVFFRHFEESMPYFGFGLLLSTVILSTLSVPYALQAHDFSGRTTDPDNVERVGALLANVDFGEQPVELSQLTTQGAFDEGRATLVKKCTVCHDMRTILAKPRTAQKWYDVSYRMLDKPSVFGTPLTPDDIPAVTAYLTAITPAIQESTKRKRADERAAASNNDDMVDRAHDASTEEAAKIPEAQGKALLEQHCTDCHELDEIDNHGGDDSAGWRSVVAAMVDEGAEYDAETTQQLVAYLSQAYPSTQGATPVPAAIPEDEETVEIVDEDAGDGDTTTDAGTASEGDTDATPSTTEGAEATDAPAPKKPKPRKPKAKKPAVKPAAKKPKAKPKGDATKGRDLFGQKCKTCHGSTGKGDTSFGKKLGVKPLLGLSQAKIKKAVLHGVPGTKMKAYKGKLTPAQIDDVTAFVRRLR